MGDAKTFIKNGIKSIFLKKKMIIIVAIIALVILLAGFKWEADAQTVNSVSKIAQTELAKSVSIEGKHWKIDDGIYQKIKEQLQEQGIDVNALGNGNNDYLQKIVKAELVTNYLNLGDEVDKNDKNKFQGIVNFIRRDAEGTSDGQVMQYMSDTEFNQYVTNGNYDAIKNYFTIDFGITDSTDDSADDSTEVNEETTASNMQIVIATKSEANGVVSISTQKINYKMQVANYSMPMEFIFAHMQMTSSADYAVAIADLVISNSKIDYVVQECYSETTVKSIYKYDQKNIQKSGNTVTVTSVTEGISQVQSTEVIKNWTVMPYIKEADTWIVNVTNKYEKRDTGPTTSEQSIEELPDEEGSNYIRYNRKTYDEVTTKNITYMPVMVSNNNSSSTEANTEDATNTATPSQGDIVIALDAGHGGDDGAGASSNGLREEVMTEETVSYMMSYLEQYENIKIVKCPKTGEGHYSERPGAAKTNNADIHITIHFNAGQGTGIETLYKSSSDTQSTSLAQTVVNSVCEATGLPNRGTKERGDLGIISTTSVIGCPSICVEGGFIDNETDRAVIGNSDGLKKVAAGVVSGILAHLGIEDKGYPDIPDFDGYTGEAARFSSTAIIKTNEEKFLGLWKNSVGDYVPYYNVDGSINEDAKYNKDGKKVKYKGGIYPADIILSSPEWFFDLLSVSERTQSHLEIMKYLMYKYSGIDFGVTSLDLSIFDTSSFSMNTRNGAISYETLNITQSDLEILYKITAAERGNGTQEQQEYVVSVILNRVLSKDFPNTVYGVVFAPMQFQPTRNGGYERATPSETTKAAVNSVIKNGDTTGGAVYFMTPAAAQGQQSWLKNCMFLFNDANNEPDGSHNFYTKQSVLDELGKYKKITTPTEMTNGINLYNSDGSVNEAAITELSNYLTSDVLNTTIHKGNSANQGGPFAKWWVSPINVLSKFQCTWWANGRASQYLELSGNPKYSKYPTQQRKWRRILRY